MNKEAVIKSIKMTPTYHVEQGVIEWLITVEYLDGHVEETDTVSRYIGGIIDMITESARYAMNPKGFK